MVKLTVVAHASLLTCALGAVNLRFKTRNQQISSLQSSLQKDNNNKIAASYQQINGDVQSSNATLTSNYNFYYADIDVGTPAQRLEVLLDTGSPVTWFWGPLVADISAASFSSNNSLTYKNINQTFQARYGAGQYSGKWGSDVLSLPGFSSDGVVDFLFGTVEDYFASVDSPGLLGLGPHISNAGPNSYTTFPEALFDQNKTESPAFSVALTEDGGDVLFGGFDLSQIKTPIYSFDFVGTNTSRWYNYYTLAIDTLSLGNQTFEYFQPGILDTGSPASLLPPTFVHTIGQKYKLTFNETLSAFYTSEPVDELEGSVTIQIGNFNLDIEVKDLFIPGEHIWGSRGPQDVLALSFIASQNIILGDAFFRAVYATFNSRDRKLYLSKRANVTNQTGEYVFDANYLDRIAIPGVNVTTSATLASTASGYTPEPTTTITEYATTILTITTSLSGVFSYTGGPTSTSVNLNNLYIDADVDF